MDKPNKMNLLKFILFAHPCRYKTNNIMDKLNTIRLFQITISYRSKSSAHALSSC